MGLIYSRLKLLLDAKNSGANFTTTAMIGRQKISLSKTENEKLVIDYDLNIEKDNFNFNRRDYADSIIKNYLNIKELKIFDYSKYEGADVIVDLNYPVQNNLHNNFDALIDGGSIEHIFNFPIAIKNYMNLVKVNGNIFIFTSANNQCGHGFYQFSPELFYSIFNETNGFEIKSVIFVEHPYPGAELSEKQICYSVKSPSEIGRRAIIVNKAPLGIMVHATKIKEVKIFKKFPLQSDYLNLWDEKKDLRLNKYFNFKSKLRLLLKFLPTKLKNNIRGIKQLNKYSLQNDKEFFKRW